MKVLLVDDNYAVHQHIKEIVENNRLDYQVHSAYCVDDAMELYATHRHDIAIVDMHMPVKNGIVFLKWIKENHHPLKMIILSGYDDYVYIRNAFLLDIEDYLLKPVNEVEILRVLEKTHKELSNDPQLNTTNQELVLVQEKFLSDVTFKKLFNENEIIVKATHLHIDLPQSGYVVAIIKLQIKDFTAHVCDHFGGESDKLSTYIIGAIKQECGTNLVFCQLHQENEFVVIADASQGLRRDDWQGLWQKLTAKPNVNCSITISETSDDLGALSDMYDQAELLQLHTTLTSDHCVFMQGDALPCSKSEAWEQTIALIHCFNEAGGFKQVDKMQQHLVAATYDKEIMRLPMGMLLSYVREYCKAVTVSAQRCEEQTLKNQLTAHVNGVLKYVQYRDLFHIKVKLLQLSQVVCLFMADINLSSGDLIWKIKLYLDEFYKNATLENTATHFHINKNYLSTLFKSSVGINFSDYITQLKMERAKYLLDNTTLKMYEISALVGYEDSRYFSQVFRKAYGVKPSQYRQVENL